jgi:hypothetical protein
MRRIILSSLALAFLLGTLGCNAQGSGSDLLQAATGGPRSWQVMDPAWGLPAATIKTPAGWGFGGTVFHPGQDCALTGHSIVFNLESRDGSQGIIELPSLRAQSFNDAASMRQYTARGCPVATGMTAADFLKSVVIPRMRPSARILATGDEPRLEAAAGHARQQLQRIRGPLAPPTVSTARIKLAYQRNGKPVEEYVSAMVVCSRETYPGMNLVHIDCTADNVGLAHAPPGQLDALVNGFDTNFSVKPNPAWLQQLQQHVAAETSQFNRQLQAQNQQSARNAAAISNNAIANIHRTGEASMAAARNSQAAIDRSAGATAAHMGDYNIYSDPHTGRQVQLSNQYDHTYINDQGTVAQQTNSAYGPVGGGWWTEMTPKY